MGIKELFSGLVDKGTEKSITWRIDPAEGVDFLFAGKVFENPDQKAMEDPFFGLQYAYLKGLYEQGFAEKNSNGYTVLSCNIAHQSNDFFELFELPDPFLGSFSARIEGSTRQSSFDVNIELELSDGTAITHYSFEGPFLKLAEDEYYRLDQPQWRLFEALKAHKKLKPNDRGEYENNWLIFQFQLAQKAGVNIDLKHFDKLEFVQPEKVGVAVEEMDNGDLALTPTYGGGIELSDIQRRFGQIDASSDKAILRVKDKFVLLDDQRLEATKEILTNRRIPKEQVSTFLKSPTAYLDAALIDLDTGFSLRVHGAERFTHKYFGDVEESGIDWFAVQEKLLESTEKLMDFVGTQELLDELKEKVNDAKNSGATIVELDEHQFDISDDPKLHNTIKALEEKLSKGNEAGAKPVTNELLDDESLGNPEAAVVAIDSNDEDDEFGKNTQLHGFDPRSQSFSKDNLKREPFVHQVEGIHWLLSHLDNALGDEGGSGALLADDMGLGKTFMTLVSIAELYKRNKAENKALKPVLIVAPLSLLENWQAEVDETFHKSPFSDIVVLQSGADLKRFRVAGAKRETLQQFDESDLIEDQDQIRYSLKVGGVYGTDRLDTPARLVLTTYQTLRDYQFSLSRIDWSVAAFDEAQNLKNPNALQTRAAKAVKCDFKLLATGTPVENSLKDFWCLMDTAVPGLLGAWQSFRSNYIEPITSADAANVRGTKMETGRNLRKAVGEYMLRRTKEEELQGMPTKTIFTGDKGSPNTQFMPSLVGMMKGEQLDHYDEIVDAIRLSSTEDKRKLVLPGLLRMKISSIHHDIEKNSPIPHKPKDFLRQAESSAKFSSMLSLLKEIKRRDEKVLIFATTKRVQAYVAAIIGVVFKTSVEVINGETKAVATKKDDATRKGIIDKFQQQEGFAAIVMSPVAAGVGLTVTGANNVIHLERHWNPAKEAQATDRVYRIGQKKDVNVYIPMALHPSMNSFDLQLNSLLGNKIDLSDAVVSNGPVEAEDLMGCFE